MASDIRLGWAVGDGAEVRVPLGHTAVTGQTQASGKTTTLEALACRSGLRTLAFVTKRGEGSFETGRAVAPYFRERADWMFVDQLLAAQLREKNKNLRPWIIRLCRTTRTLADVQAAVRAALPKARGYPADIYTALDAYLDLVVPEIARAPFAERLALGTGLNVMNLAGYATPMQMLCVQSAIDWINERERGVVVIMPEAWEFVPQGAGSPVKASATSLVRKGAALGNWLWIDSQDMAAVDNVLLRGCTVWLVGVQREANELKRNLANIPAGLARPTASDVALLDRGQFFACFRDRVVKTYVQPAWMPDDEARRIARGSRPVPASNASQPTAAAQEQGDPTMCQEHAKLAREVETQRRTMESDRTTIAALRERVEAQSTRLGDLERAAKASDLFRQAFAALGLNGAGPRGPIDETPIDDDALVARIIARLPAHGAPLVVTPPEKLRAEFQREEVARIVAAVGALSALQRRVLLLVEALPTDDCVSQPTIAQRLGRSTGGGSWVDLTKAIKAIAADGWLELRERQGVRRALRAKIAADLAHYGASDADVEATYQSALHAIATDGSDAD